MKLWVITSTAVLFCGVGLFYVLEQNYTHNNKSSVSKKKSSATSSLPSETSALGPFNSTTPNKVNYLKGNESQETKAAKTIKNEISNNLIKYIKIQQRKISSEALALYPEQLLKGFSRLDSCEPPEREQAVQLNAATCLTINLAALQQSFPYLKTYSYKQLSEAFAKVQLSIENFESNFEFNEKLGGTYFEPFSAEYLKQMFTEAHTQMPPPLYESVFRAPWNALIIRMEVEEFSRSNRMLDLSLAQRIEWYLAKVSDFNQEHQITYQALHYKKRQGLVQEIESLYFDKSALTKEAALDIESMVSSLIASEKHF